MCFLCPKFVDQFKPEEIKWKVTEMKRGGYSNRTIMETHGIENVSKIKT